MELCFKKYIQKRKVSGSQMLVPLTDFLSARTVRSETQIIHIEHTPPPTTNTVAQIHGESY